MVYGNNRKDLRGPKQDEVQRDHKYGAGDDSIESLVQGEDPTEALLLNEGDDGLVHKGLEHTDFQPHPEQGLNGQRPVFLALCPQESVGEALADIVKPVARRAHRLEGLRRELLCHGRGGPGHGPQPCQQSSPCGHDLGDEHFRRCSGCGPSSIVRRQRRCCHIAIACASPTARQGRRYEDTRCCTRGQPQAPTGQCGTQDRRERPPPMPAQGWCWRPVPHRSDAALAPF
mmetsp:Transcript_4782/g.10659  ORF Transcript_4782/g.10659 Transcript_4782/m.10659 type:complete len:230 (-) Transcript_4782:12-701(-)